MYKMSQLIAISGLTAVLSGCGGPSDFSPAEGMSAADIYASTCQSCHGENGAGKFGFLFKIVGSESSPEEMAAALTEGGSIMPSFPNLSDEQRLMMAAYIKSF
jgi:mono/diheme cytochrome c family protein